MEQQNPPIPPSPDNQLIANWTTKPTGLLTAIALKNVGLKGLSWAGFVER
ncbi:hypothetical protein [Coleofasciculus sp. E2-BRE-01]|jgi:hypothetical protein